MPAWFTWRIAGMVGAPLALLLAIALCVVTLQKNARIGTLAEANRILAEQVVRTRVDLGQCRANGATLEAALARQNEAVAAMQAEGARRADALDRAADEARRQAATAEARARAILNRQGTGAACADAEALILETVR